MQRDREMEEKQSNYEFKQASLFISPSPHHPPIPFNKTPQLRIAPHKRGRYAIYPESRILTPDSCP